MTASADVASKNLDTNERKINSPCLKKIVDKVCSVTTTGDITGFPVYGVLNITTTLLTVSRLFFCFYFRRGPTGIYRVTFKGVSVCGVLNKQLLTY